MSNNKQRVIDYCRAHPKGSSCEDWERDLKMSHQTASALLAEMCEDGILKDTGERSRTKSGATGRKVVLAKDLKEPVGFF
jgi:hypothetical protein